MYNTSPSGAYNVNKAARPANCRPGMFIGKSRGVRRREIYFKFLNIRFNVLHKSHQPKAMSFGNL